MEILEQGPGQGPGQQQQADRPRITTRYLTKYEKARVLGTRALQASGGAWQGAAGAARLPLPRPGESPAGTRASMQLTAPGSLAAGGSCQAMSRSCWQVQAVWQARWHVSHLRWHGVPAARPAD